jgi:peptidoglycan/LPS O-acetylase OafA/YrhL
MFLLASGQFYTPWSWLPRILMQFTAGVIACAAVRRLQPGERTRTAAGIGAIVIVAVMIGSCTGWTRTPSRMSSTAVAWSTCCSSRSGDAGHRAGTLPRLLSTRPLVYGGQISFSLYMVTNWCTPPGSGRTAVRADDGRTRGSVVAARGVRGGARRSVALYHWVEEPARHWMRRMVGTRTVLPRVHSVESVPGCPLDRSNSPILLCRRASRLIFE